MKSFAFAGLVLIALCAQSYAKSVRAVTDAELLTISRDLHAADVNAAAVTLDLQGQTTAGDYTDKAPGRLIVSDPTNDFAKPTYAAALLLLDNFQKNVTIQETLTTAQLAEEKAFIDAIMETSVMQLLHQFLVSKGEATSDVPSFKQYLTLIWFGRYAAVVPGVVASSGWEHVSVGERLTDNSLVGYHSWLYLFNEEEDGDTNYLGYINVTKTATTTVISMPVELYGSRKAATEFNIGASPELEIALGTLCFIVRPDQPCFVQGADEVKYTMETMGYTYNGFRYIEGAHPTFKF